METFENIEIQPDEIKGAEELTPEPDAAAETAPSEPEQAAVPEDPAPEEIPEEPELDDALVQTMAAANAAMQAAEARIAELEARLNALEAQEAARAKKMTGFFAPVQNAGKDPGADPLPRVDRKYTF